MAVSALYTEGKVGMLSGTVNLPTNTIKAALIDTGTYTFSAAHTGYASLSGVVGTDITLGSKTVTGGTFDAADGTWTTVSGNSAEAIVIYQVSPDLLLAYLDDSAISVTPNGNDINVTWDGSGIFSL